MPNNKKFLIKATLGTVLSIGLILLVIFSLSFLITSILGFSSKVNLSLGLKIVGGAIFIGGIGLAWWLFKYRSPGTMIVSTYFTFVKMFTRSPISKLEGRTEPLIISGPQRFVRHPLYLAATAMFLGWALLTGSTSSFIAGFFILLWFSLVQIPFEEKELRSIFGDQYGRYSKKVPMFIPLKLKRRTTGPDTDADRTDRLH